MENMGSECNYERSSEGKDSKEEQNQKTVAAIVHCTPVTSNEIPESIIEHGDILPETFTHQNLTTEVAEKQSSLAFLVRGDNNNNRSTTFNHFSLQK